MAILVGLLLGVFMIIQIYKWWSTTCMLIMWMQEHGWAMPTESDQKRLFTQIIRNLFKYGL